MNSTKKCAECGRELPLSEFNKNRKNKDGLQGRCRECFSRYNKARYASSREKFKSDIYAYKKANPYNVLDSRIKTCLKNPTHRNANMALNEAVSAGVVETPEHCSGCGISGKETRLGAHHYDYAKPLDVVWVCAKCHRSLDAARREREGKKPYETAKAVRMVIGDKTVCTFETIAEASRSTGMPSSTIHGMLRSGKPTPSGFKWARVQGEEC